MSVSVIIPAAGAGKRMGGNQKKQYLHLKGKPVLYHTIKAFNAHPLITEIILVAPIDELEFIRLEIATEFDKISAIVAGGKERQDSVMNGLAKVSESATIILVHDGVRPLIQAKQIDDICQALQDNDAAVIAVPEKNTVKLVENGFVVATPERSKVWSIQTPQGMKADVFRLCYNKLSTQNVLGTDEAMIAENFGYKVAVIPGDYKNIKLTTPEDLQIAELFLEN